MGMGNISSNGIDQFTTGNKGTYRIIRYSFVDNLLYNEYMVKKYVIYINGKDLATFPVTQKKWKGLKGYEDKYLVSTDGEIKSLYYNKTLKPQTNFGYSIVCLTLGGKEFSKRIHRLVAETFIPNPQNLPFINHINGKKHDNRIGNLEWCTHSHNIKHDFKMGIRNLRGENNNMAKLTEKDTETIKLALSMGIRHQDIADKFGVSRALICLINTGKRWGHIKLNTV